MLILLSSGVIADRNGSFHTGIIEALKLLKDAGHTLALISNRVAPAWLNKIPYLNFVRAPGRRNGKIITQILTANPHLAKKQIVILGSSDDDFLMAVNSQTLLLRCNWTPLESKIRKYGIPCAQPSFIPEMVNFLSNQQPIYFHSSDTFLDIYSLTDAGTKYETDNYIRLSAQRLQGCLKGNRQEYKAAYILHFLSSVYAIPELASADLWGYYPSSASPNDGSEVMAEFCMLAREMNKRRGQAPLFIRHTASIKRHILGGDRENPLSQIESIHLNPEYQRKIQGKVVVVLDDYLTKGLSFGVASALLQKAGAKKVIALAMGKFGSSSSRYEIFIDDNPFAPIKKWHLKSKSRMVGAINNEAKLEFVRKFKV